MENGVSFNFRKMLWKIVYERSEESLIEETRLEKRRNRKVTRVTRSCKGFRERNDHTISHLKNFCA